MPVSTSVTLVSSSLGIHVFLRLRSNGGLLELGAPAISTILLYRLHHCRCGDAEYHSVRTNKPEG